MCTCSCAVGKKQASFSMTIGNEELMQECFPKHLRMWENKKEIRQRKRRREARAGKVKRARKNEASEA